MQNTQQIKDVILTQRCCKHCGEVKPIDEFYKTSGVNGYRHRCKPCETIRRSAYFKTYYTKNHKPADRKVGRPKKLKIEVE